MEEGLMSVYAVSFRLLDWMNRVALTGMRT
jgi:hypothetical protein